MDVFCGKSKTIFKNKVTKKVKTKEKWFKIYNAYSAMCIKKKR